MALGLKCKSVAAYSLVSFMASSFSSLCANANINEENYDISNKKSGGYKEQQITQVGSGAVSSKSNNLCFLVKFFGVLILILASIYALLLFFKCKNEGNPENSKLNSVQKNKKGNKQLFSKNNEHEYKLIKAKHKKIKNKESSELFTEEGDEKFQKEGEPIYQRCERTKASYIRDKEDAMFGVLKLKSKCVDCIRREVKDGKVLEEEIMLDNVEVDIDGENMFTNCEEGGLFGWK